jgi:heme A synthase
MTLREYFHRFDAVLGVLIVLGVAWFIHNRWKNRLRVA